MYSVLINFLHHIIESLYNVVCRCGDLKVLALPRDLVYLRLSVMLKLISKWKYLESLILGSSHHLVEILSQISIHCKDFCALYLGDANIGIDEAMAIVIIKACFSW